MTTSPLAKRPKPPKAVETATKKRNPTIEDFNFPDGLLTAEDLPDSDDTPVDSELQELIPGLLKSILLDLWSDRIQNLSISWRSLLFGLFPSA